MAEDFLDRLKSASGASPEKVLRVFEDTCLDITNLILDRG